MSEEGTLGVLRTVSQAYDPLFTHEARTAWV